MSKLADMHGKRFGRLTVIGRAPRPMFFINEGAWWTCRCDCGFVGDFFGGNLRRGCTKSCGCLRKDAARERLQKRRADHGTKEN